MKRWIVTTALAAVVTCAGLPQAQAQDEIVDEDVSFVDENADGIHDGFRGRRLARGLARFADQLTEDQLSEVQARIAELRESDATREEVGEAVHELLEGYGVELPDPGERLSSHLGDLLTDEQLQSLIDEVTALREAGATHGDIRTAVDATLEELGIDRPAPTGAGGPRAGVEGKFQGGRRGRAGRFGGYVPAPEPEPIADPE